MLTGSGDVLYVEGWKSGRSQSVFAAGSGLTCHPNAAGKWNVPRLTPSTSHPLPKQEQFTPFRPHAAPSDVDIQCFSKASPPSLAWTALDRTPSRGTLALGYLDSQAGAVLLRTWFDGECNPFEHGLADREGGFYARQ